ncbi:hypothetical protein [Hydrogenophaga sp.]|uniref:hypothetical protein n=1 Tax=Hydrogenophaga sp. TaxID=1904254 RepID=UPI003F7296C8
MIGLKKELRLTVSGDAAKDLQLLARRYDMRLEDLMMRMVALTSEYEQLSRQGYHLGVAKDVSKLDFQFTGMWS